MPSTTHALLRTFHKRSFVFTLVLALILAVTVPYLRYVYSIEDYKRDSLEIVHRFLASELNFDLSELLTAPRPALVSRVEVFMGYGNLLEFRVWDAQGRVVYSHGQPEMVGRSFVDNDELLETLRTGQALLEVAEPTKREQAAFRGQGTLLEMYVPVIHQGRVVGAVELYRDAPRLTLLTPGNLLYGLAALILPLLLHVFFYGQFKQAAFQLVRSGEQLRQAYDALASASFDSVRSLAKALEMRDMETEGHSERVVALAVIIGQRMGLPRQEMAKLVIGAYLHDVGKIGVPDAILLKPGSLTPEERVVMQTHVTKGGLIVDEVGFLRLGAEVVLHHHERWDGRGYWRGLKGEEIPITARIFALVDVFDALMSKRPYKEPYGSETSCEIIRSESGGHFDPRVVEAFFSITAEELAGIRTEVAKNGVHSMVRQATQVLFDGGYLQHCIGESCPGPDRNS